MKLQVNTAGAWRNVIEFTPAQALKVLQAVKILQTALGDRAKWCVLHDDGQREWL